MCLNCTSLQLRILCSIHHRPCHISRSRISASRWCEPYYGMVSSSSVHHRRSLATDRASCEYQSLTGAGYSSRWYHRLWHVILVHDRRKCKRTNKRCFKPNRHSTAQTPRHLLSFLKSIYIPAAHTLMPLGTNIEMRPAHRREFPGAVRSITCNTCNTCKALQCLPQPSATHLQHGPVSDEIDFRQCGCVRPHCPLVQKSVDTFMVVVSAISAR
jgi:hypothetical protein